MSTVLAPLPLLAVNSAGVESLASYVLRLASTHDVSPFRLSRLLSEYWTLRGTRKPHVNLDYLLLCSYSPSTAHMVEILESLTGQSNLSQGTLLPLAKCLTSNFSGCIATHRRWCPKCYRDSDGFAMEPLAWGMSLITWCPVHDAELQSQCGWCGTRQRYFRRTEHRASCHTCGRSLSKARAEDDKLRTPWNVWCQQQMLDLLGRMTADDCPSFPENPFRVIVEAVEEWPFAERARLKFLENCIKAHRERGAMPRLATVFRFAAAQSCSPFDVLQAPRECSSRLLFDSTAPIQPPPRKPRIRADVIAAFQEELLRLMQTPETLPLPSLESVCATFGTSPAQLYNSRRELYSRYGAERRRRCAGHKARTKVRATDIAMEELCQVIGSGSPLKRKRSIAKLIELTKLPKHFVEAAWNSAVAAVKHQKNIDIEQG